MRNLLLIALFTGLVAGNAALAAAADEGEDVLPLDRLTISAEKKREMMARILRIGFSNIRSDRPEDANKIVCEVRKSTGSHISNLYCGTNAAFNYQRDTNFTMHSGFVASMTVTPRWSDAAGVHKTTHSTGSAKSFAKLSAVMDAQKVMEYRGVSQGSVNAMIEEYAEGVSDEENRRMLERDMVWSNFAAAEGRHGFTATQYTDFVYAYRAVKRIENTVNNLDRQEAEMIRAITANNLSVDDYNAILDLVTTDGDLHARTMDALEISI